MDISDRTFLITGAGSGLGAATAKRLVAAGARVALVDVNRAGGEAVARETGEAGVFIEADVCNESAVQNAVAETRRRFGRIDGAVNCAGIAPGERVVGREGPHSLATFNRAIQINLVGTFNVIRLCADAMKDNAPGEDGERGVLINTASVAAYEGQIGQAAYSASKAGVVGMTLPIARELARFGIRVMTIAPGVFETPMVAGFSQAVQDSLGAQVPFPSRLGRADEYAMLVEHILVNRMLNGAVIRLDGAIRMGAK